MAICVFDISSDGTAQVPSDTAVLGPAAYRWWHYDLSDPDLQDWALSKLPTIPAHALLQPETRPRCDRYEDGLILNLRGINLNEGQPADQMVSVRIWVTENAIVTVRLRKVFALDHIRQAVTAQAAPRSAFKFIEVLVAQLTSHIQNEVAHIASLTEFFETDLEDESTPPPKDLNATRRNVIRLRRYLEPQRTALNKLASTEPPLLPSEDALKLRELANRTTIAVEELDALRDRLITVQDEHDLSIARVQARHGYILSIAAGLFLPLGFLTGLFGVNIAGMPGLDNPWAFGILCLSILALAVTMIGVMRLLRWL